MNNAKPQHARIQERIGNVVNLPTLPGVVTRLMRAIRDPDIGTSEIARLIGQDISLSAKVLRLANSAFYGIPRTITNVANAVVVLGLQSVNTLVLSCTVFDMFSKPEDADCGYHVSFWRHCLQTALLSRILAEQTHSRIHPDDAFCVGLLHDLGKIAMDQYLHSDFEAVVKNAQKEGISFHEAEIRTIDYTHTNVGEWLTGEWELPEALLRPIRHHHCPDDDIIEKESTTLVHVADRLSYQSEYTGKQNGIAPPPAGDPLVLLGCEHIDPTRIKRHFIEEWAGMDVFRELASD